MNAAAVGADGSILLGGFEDRGTPGGGFPMLDRVVVAKLLADGSLDTTFGGDVARPGVVVFDDLQLNAHMEEARAVIPLADGGAIVAGIFDAAIDMASFGGFVLKIDAHGNLDPGFGTGGIVRLPFSVLDAAMDSQGRLVLVGEGRNGVPAFRAVVARILGSSGALDVSFDEDGVFDLVERGDDGTVVDHEGGAYAVAVVPGDDVVVGGYQVRDATTVAFSLARLHDGKLDTSFADDGWLRFVPEWTNSPVNVIDDIAIAPDGDIVIAAEFREDTSNSVRPVIARFAADGTRRDAFGSPESPGFRPLSVADGYDLQAPRGLVVQQDGRIVYGALIRDRVTNQAPRMVTGRLTAEGKADLDYANGPVGPVPEPTQMLADVYTLALQDNRPIVVGSAGFREDPQDPWMPIYYRTRIIRLNNDSLFLSGFDGLSGP
ncbi:hypothetical protein [Dokdonella sp.]|uniref:hypothetical protein n=1 Tax=Dokdonella sp. TaxID=2291710 RepID=UPI002F42F923